MSPKIATFCFALLLAAIPSPAWSEEPGAGQRSADDIAKELANPAGSLASLNNNLEFRDYKGSLPGADGQDGWSYTFQPSLPFPVGDQGRRIIFRPQIPVKLDEPIFDRNDLDFYGDGPDLGDISFDLVFAGTETGEGGDGFLWGIGTAGTFPTASENAFGGDQWRLGPEVFGGLLRKWGLIGGLLSHQWEVGGSNDAEFSFTALQYFYAYGLGNGWQIAASPIVTFDWKARSDEAWSVPIGFGLAKTSRIGSMPIKLQLQVQKYVVQPKAFGPDWLVKFTFSPVIKNPFVR